MANRWESAARREMVAGVLKADRRDRSARGERAIRRDRAT